VYSWVTLNAKMFFGMVACTETFATLIKFMTSMNWSSSAWRSGTAWDNVSSMTQRTSGTNVSGRVCVRVKGGHFELLVWFKSTHLLMFRSKHCVKYIKLLLIFLFFTRSCSDTFRVRWEIWHQPCCNYTAESNSERIVKIGPNFSNLWTNRE